MTTKLNNRRHSQTAPTNPSTGLIRWTLRYHDQERCGNDDSLCSLHVTHYAIYIPFHLLYNIGVHTEFTNERYLSTDTNVDTTTAMEPIDTGNVEDVPFVVPKPKKSKRVSVRGVTKRGYLVDDEILSLPTLSIDNDGSDNVVELPYIPQEPRESTTNVPSVTATLFHLT